MSATVTIEVELDVSDVLKEASVDQLLAEIDSRNVNPGGGGNVLTDILRLMREGRYADAESLCERSMAPKYASRAAAQLEYVDAMRRAGKTPSAAAVNAR